MIDRQSCYEALFKLKTAGINVDSQLKVMSTTRGVPREVIEFLRENSPQFQFYRYIQKHQKALAKNILDYEALDNTNKLIVGSSFITRFYIAVKCNNLSITLLDELHIGELSVALSKAVTYDDFDDLDRILLLHKESLKVFYLNIKE